ncbi:hypothetical protein SDC9_83034 [bioreactor metagenome]|uniref:Uncharacterized protein n=1 Tax=bioreactor metagenome TaxID=1076179 RepID=A0A644Z830_9ZZZZ
MEVLQLHRLDRSGSKHPCIGDEQIHTACLPGYFIHHLCDRGLIGHIDRKRLCHRDARLIVELIGQLLRSLSVHICDIHKGSHLHQRTDHAFAEALGTAGNQGDLVPHHIRAAL